MRRLGKREDVAHLSDGWNAIVGGRPDSTLDATDERAIRALTGLR